MKNKDYTKYKFNNKAYCKCKLVLAIVREHVTKNSNLTFDRLLEAFPDNLQSNTRIQFSKIRVVVKKLHEIAENDKKRFFLKKSDIISLADVQVAVCREWNKENIHNFITRARQLGYLIVI